MMHNRFSGNGASNAEIMPPTRVFICYARADQDTSKLIRQALENDGIEVLQDLDQFEPGDPWWKRAVELITSSDRVVFIASPTSVQSMICDNELKEASEQGKVILPVRIDGVIWQEMPEVVAGIHGIHLPLDNSAATAAALAELIDSVSTNVTWVRTNTQYFAEARRWNQGGRKPSDLLRGRRLLVGRAWVDTSPPVNETIHPLTMQFMAASAAGERKRRLLGVAAALVALAVVGVTALFASFYNSDADLTATRLALAAGEIRTVEQRFAEWSAAPLTNVLPRPASAESLATEILNYGLIANEERIRFSLKEGEELGFDEVRIIPAGEHLHLLYPISAMAASFGKPETEIPVAAYLAVCSAAGTSCQTHRVDAEPGHELMLLASSDRVFVADRKFPTNEVERSSIAAQEESWLGKSAQFG